MYTHVRPHLLGILITLAAMEVLSLFMFGINVEGFNRIPLESALVGPLAVTGAFLLVGFIGVGALTVGKGRDPGPTRSGAFSLIAVAAAAMASFIAAGANFLTNEKVDTEAWLWGMAISLVLALSFAWTAVVFARLRDAAERNLKTRKLPRLFALLFVGSCIAMIWVHHLLSWPQFWALAGVQVIFFLLVYVDVGRTVSGHKEAEKLKRAKKAAQKAGARKKKR